MRIGVLGTGDATAPRTPANDQQFGTTRPLGVDPAHDGDEEGVAIDKKNPSCQGRSHLSFQWVWSHVGGRTRASPPPPPPKPPPEI